jgi:tRNA (guanosine-2'-O-)-methyltransferase
VTRAGSARGGQLDSTGLKRLHREWRRRTEGRLALVLDNVTTTFNVGSILRTAAALRVEHLWLAGDSATPSHPKVRRVALGSDRYVPWSLVPSATEAIAAARTDGFAIVAMELAHGAIALHELALAGPACLVVGHEDRGLAPETLAACDHVAFLPQLGKVGSLNVATATAIALYEFRRREWTAGP